MNNYRVIGVFFLALLSVLTSKAKNVYDIENCNIQRLFSEKEVTYIIRFAHQFCDTLIIPPNCELRFKGGSLNGPIVFDNSKLSGDVKLKGSSVSGCVNNEFFNASWLCTIDGQTDDARSINEMIEVCGKVYFPKGNYKLVSRFNPTGHVQKKLQKNIKAHLGICKSNVELIGESGANFLTNDSLGTICIFSKPNKIEKSIRNIKIKNINFKVHNDGVVFREFLHTIKTIGVNGLTIENCSFNDFWGDAICLSHYGDNPKTGERTLNQNVKILNNIIIGGDHHNNRNGISVISGKNIFIKNNIIKNTSRKDMPGGIDIEPNNSAYTIENIIIEDNEIEGIKGHRGAIVLHLYKGGSAHHIEIVSNKIKKSVAGIIIAIKTDDTSDSIIVKNNYIDADTPPYKFQGKGKSKDWIISGNIFERACRQEIPGDIIVHNLVAKNNKKK